jgi:hypothetical protein
MAAAKKAGWNDHEHLRRRFSRLTMARRLELAEESERFRREAYIVGKPRNRPRPNHEFGI